MTLTEISLHLFNAFILFLSASKAHFGENLLTLPWPAQTYIYPAFLRMFQGCSFKSLI